MFNCLYPHYFYLGAADDFSFDIEAQTPLNQHFYATGSDHQEIESGGSVDSFSPTSYKILRCFIGIPIVAASATIGCGLGLILSIPAAGYGIYESCTQEHLFWENNQPISTRYYNGAWRRRFIHPCAFCCLTPFYGAMCGATTGISVFEYMLYLGCVHLT